MKYYLYIFLFFQLASISYSHDWNVISSEKNTSYYDIDALDSLHYVISGEYNISPSWYFFIKSSSDAGKTWNIIWKNTFSIPNNSSPKSALKVKYIAKNTIITGTEDGLLLRTTNLGKSWDTTDLGNKDICRSMSFYNKRYGVASFLLTDFIVLTDDSGKTWYKLYKPKIENFDLLYNIDDIIRLNDSIIIGTYYRFEDDTHWIIKTTNKGISWNYYQTNILFWFKFDFVNENIGYFAGKSKKGSSGYSIIYKTTNQGNSWENIYSDLDDRSGFYGIKCISQDNVIALGFNNKLLKTIDGGLTWSNVDFESYNDMILNNIAFGSKTTGLIIAQRKYILSNSITTNIEEKNIPANSRLSIFPNPLFVNNLNIKTNLESNSNITIDLINSLGIKVGKTLLDYFNAGSHTIRYSPDANLPSGTYWIRMTINNKETIVKPVVIIK